MLPIFELFSKRQKRLRTGEPEAYLYDQLPNALRVQIVHIWTDTLGGQEQCWSEDVKRTYEAIVNALCREYGLLRLPGAQSQGERDYLAELTRFFLQEERIERLLDVVEISFKSIDSYTRRWEYLHRRNAGERADAAIAELNVRFKEHGVGYQFHGGKILRVDSLFIDTEVVKPALRLFNKNYYSTIEDKFLEAWEYYRHGEQGEALKACTKACENMMKTLCDRCNWGYPKDVTVKALIEICIAKQLVAPVWQDQLRSLGTMLDMGRLDMGRLDMGRLDMAQIEPGSGSDQETQMPRYLAAHILNVAAATLICLAAAEEVWQPVD